MDERPVILIVDDQPTGLAAMTEALTRRFGADYRVVAHSSPHDALAALSALKKARQDVALVIADQWMPHMKGIELLGRVRSIDPAAKRALLVRWGDRRAAPAILEGCAFDQLDNYLLKPWTPAEVHLYPAVTEFLAEWTREQRPPLELVRIVADEHAGRAHEVDELLLRNGVPHGFHLSSSHEGCQLLEETGMVDAARPVIVLLGGRALANPSNTELAEALGATNLADPRCDVAIVGGGPAGLAAAVYAASEGLRTVVIEPEAVGGQAGTSTLIRNYLGFPRGISGAELAQRAYQQAWLFGAQYVFARAARSLRPDGVDRVLTLTGGLEIRARAVLIACGASYRQLEVPSVDRFVGRGVFYAAMGDARVVHGREVAVVGAGNAAGQAVVHLAKHAERVHLIVRGPTLTKSMSSYLIREIEHQSRIVVRLDSEVVRGDGDRKLQQIDVHDRRTGATHPMAVDMLFVMIGAQPHTQWLDETVRRDAHGFILTGHDLAAEGWALPRPPLRFEASLPGVFAAGDVRAGSSKRVASAVGEGAVAIQYVHQYLHAPAYVGAPLPARSATRATADAGAGWPSEATP